MGLFKSLAIARLLQKFADRDLYNAFGIWPRCADGSREHDMKGLPRCPACGFEPTVCTPGHARARAERATEEADGP